MGSELVIGELPSKTNYTTLFWEAYPAYLTMGMPPEEYWNGDARACNAYRKAYKERLEMQDAMLWRQGLYVYHALCCVAPYFNSIKPRKPEEYIAKPFGITDKEEPPKEDYNAGLEYMKAWANRVNAMRKQANAEQHHEN